MNRLSKLPFAHLNLRFNPFGELTRDERAAVAQVELGDLPLRLQRSGQAVQFVADHGRGKSTHLLALHRQFPLAPYTQLHPGDRPSFARQALHFVDSVENLPASARTRLYQRAASIALTAHIDLSAELSAAGYCVSTVNVGLSDPVRLHQVLNGRIEFARRADGPLPTLQFTAVDILQQMFGDDIRAMESHLYYVFQSLQGVGDVEVHSQDRTGSY